MTDAQTERTYPLEGVAVPAMGPTEVCVAQQSSGDFVLTVAGHDYLIEREDGLALGRVLLFDEKE